MHVWLLTVTTAFLMMLAPAAARAADGGVLVDPMAYPDAAAARAAWTPMEGVAPVEPATIDGVTAVRFPCNFNGTDFDRASWDRSLGLTDLTAGDAITFRFHCADRASIGRFNLYLQSGDGWYAASFAPPGGAGWSTITIPKHETNIEGAPAGWSRVRTIRISAWRGGDTDTSFAVADLRTSGGAGEGSGVCIVRGESVGRTSPGEAESVSQFTASMATHLRDLGIGAALLSDADLTPDVLARQRVVILPHNPSMPDNAAEALAAFVRGGGRVLACYQLPPPLAEAIGVRVVGYQRAERPGQFAAMRFDKAAAPRGAPDVVRQRSWNIQHVAPAENSKMRIAARWADAEGKNTTYPAVLLSDRAAYVSHVLLADDPDNQRQMLLALLGHLEPRVWEQAASAAVARVGTLNGRPPTHDEPWHTILQGARGRLEVMDSMKQVRTLLATALEQLRGGEHAAAIASAQDAQRQLVEAYCRIQPRRINDFRAAWCHSAFGPDGMRWDAALKVMADNGFTAILPNMLWGGVAYYESDVLPIAPEVKTQGDQIAACLAAARKYGLQVHVWKVHWNMGSATPQSFVDRMKGEGRTQVSFDGKPAERWLCPSHPDNQKLEVDAMVEVATKYDVDGVHFDYIRYPGPDNCFCPRCRERFETRIGRAVKNWPADTRGAGLRAAWNDFRRDNITKVVAAVSDKLRKDRPKVKLSAAVFSDWPADRDNVGQDWKLWCDRGYLDFVCPMDYTPHDGQFEHWVSQQKQWAGKVPVYPGIGLSTWPARDVPQLIEQINITRRHSTGGFTIFEYRTAEARDVLPMLGLGVTREK